jgi:hypothetical protein
MTNGREYGGPAVYQIRVKGNLEPRWSDWFDGFTITPQAGDETLLVGLVPDQPALHGLLAKIRDLGLPIVLVRRIDDGQDRLSHHTGGKNDDNQDA